MSEEEKLVNVQYVTTQITNEGIREVVDLDIKTLGQRSRDALMEYFIDTITETSPLAEMVLKNLPPDTRTPWEKSRDAMERFYEDFKIGLSKRIYDWSGYEDGCY